jgi:hypothetical protein
MSRRAHDLRLKQHRVAREFAFPSLRKWPGYLVLFLLHSAKLRVENSGILILARLPPNHRKASTMKLYVHVLIAVALLTLPACEQKGNANRTDGIKDALDARPNEGIRDAGEDIGHAVKDAGRDIKNAVKNN